MKNIQDKYLILRTATAVSVLKASREAVHACKTGDTPKGPVIDIARAAGIMAAKKTAELIPFCHPVPLDHAAVEIKCGDTIEITASATAIAKTGVEMEALTAASVAALTVYDMLKPIDASIEITSTRLIEKRGGKSDFAALPSEKIRAAILVTSDRCSKDNSLDKTGPAIFERLKNLNVDIAAPVIVPDDRQAIEAKLRAWCRENIDLVITSGGTGIGTRDCTTEATRAVIERELPGIAEAIRSHGQMRTPYAMFSRCAAGISGKTLIVNLPGSERAVEEGLSVILPAIFHAFDMMKDKPHG